MNQEIKRADFIPSRLAPSAWLRCPRFPQALSRVFLAFSVVWQDLNSALSLMLRLSFSASSLWQMSWASVRDLLSCSISASGSVSVRDRGRERERDREKRDEKEKGVRTLEGLHILLEGTTRFVHLEGSGRPLLQSCAWPAQAPCPCRALGVFGLSESLLKLIDLVFELLHIDLEGFKTLLKQKRWREAEVREGRSNTSWSCGSSLQQTLHPQLGRGAHLSIVPAASASAVFFSSSLAVCSWHWWCTRGRSKPPQSPHVLRTAQSQDQRASYQSVRGPSSHLLHLSLRKKD